MRVAQKYSYFVLLLNQLIVTVSSSIKELQLLLIVAYHPPENSLVHMLSCDPVISVCTHASEILFLLQFKKFKD